MKPVFFKAASEFRRWLQKHHDRQDELWVGFYRKDSGKLSLTWPESVDQALCFGWIDGVRKSCSDISYMIRFTPRRAKSIWSRVNLARVAELKKQGLLHASGIAVFEGRDPEKCEQYSFENRRDMSPEFLKEFKANKAAWAYFTSQPPWYQKTTAHWVMSAKKEETRRWRLSALIADSRAKRDIKAVARSKRKVK